MRVYRSGLRFVPPLALGGHTFSRVAHTKPTPPAAPSWWRCCSCYVVLPDWAIKEGFYPRPCMGDVRALPRGAAA